LFYSGYCRATDFDFIYLTCVVWECTRRRSC